jgi:hypothetical protein
MNMVTRLTDRIYDLDMGLAMALDRDHDKTIRCVETHLWIAEEGWAEDVILSSGECHASKRSVRAMAIAYATVVNPAKKWLTINDIQQPIVNT